MTAIMVAAEEEQQHAAVVQRVRNRTKEDEPMNDALQRYIGRTCLIRLLGSAHAAPFDVKGIEGHWMTVVRPSGEELINTDLIVAIAEHVPRKSRKER